MYTYNCFGRENHGHLTDRDAVECREEQEYNAAPPHCPWHDIDLDELVVLLTKRDEVILGLNQESGEQ